MNIGFLIGMFVSGLFGKYNMYGTVFALGGIANFVAITLVAINWRTLRDKDTYLTDLAHDKRKVRIQHLKAAGIIIVTLGTLLILMRHAEIANNTIIILSVVMVIFAFFIGTSKVKKGKERGRMLAFCFFLIATCIFWTVYQLTPEVLMLFIAHNVDLTIAGIKIMPQWLNMINSAIIVVGGPFCAWYFNYLRVKKGKKISLPFLFAFAIFCMGLAILLQAVGIMFDASAAGTIGVVWVILFFVFQSIGELCISPIGYAAIGKLVPRKLQNLMMGLWCMMSGVAALFAVHIGDLAIQGQKLTNPLLTDPGFEKTFGILGLVTIAICIIMFIFRKKLCRMIDDTKVLAKSKIRN